MRATFKCSVFPKTQDEKPRPNVHWERERKGRDKIHLLTSLPSVSSGTQNPGHCSDARILGLDETAIVHGCELCDRGSQPETCPRESPVKRRCTCRDLPKDAWRTGFLDDKLGAFEPSSRGLQSDTCISMHSLASDGQDASAGSKKQQHYDDKDENRSSNCQNVGYKGSPSSGRVRATQEQDDGQIFVDNDFASFKDGCDEPDCNNNRRGLEISYNTSSKSCNPTICSAYHNNRVSTLTTEPIRRPISNLSFSPPAENASNRDSRERDACGIENKQSARQLPDKQPGGRRATHPVQPLRHGTAVACGQFPPVLRVGDGEHDSVGCDSGRYKARADTRVDDRGGCSSRDTHTVLGLHPTCKGLARSKSNKPESRKLFDADQMAFTCLHAAHAASWKDLTGGTNALPLDLFKGFNVARAENESGRCCPQCCQCHPRFDVNANCLEIITRCQYSRSLEKGPADKRRAPFADSPCSLYEARDSLDARPASRNIVSSQVEESDASSSGNRDDIHSLIGRHTQSDCCHVDLSRNVGAEQSEDSVHLDKRRKPSFGADIFPFSPAWASCSHTPAGAAPGNVHMTRNSSSTTTLSDASDFSSSTDSALGCEGELSGEASSVGSTNGAVSADGKLNSRTVPDFQDRLTTACARDDLDAVDDSVFEVDGSEEARIPATLDNRSRCGGKRLQLTCTGHLPRYSLRLFKVQSLASLTCQEGGRLLDLQFRMAASLNLLRYGLLLPSDEGVGE